MLWVGLTGGIACGKSTVAGLLRARGFTVIDADLLAREVVVRGTSAHLEIAQIFGADAIGDDGELHRAKIGAAVFSDRSKLNQLEAIIHPLVRARTQVLKQELAATGAAIGFYDVPLLFEKKMQQLFDQIVVVTCRPEIQLSRLMARNQMSEVEANKRIASQLPLAEKVAGADHVIANNGDASALEISVGKMLDLLLKNKVVKP